MSKYKVFVSLFALCFGATLQAEVLIASPKTKVSLLELYTSEGCSSCPPADKWLSKLKTHQGLWTEIIPVAFHVDYWNYIGWEDRFSSPEYASRQRRYARSKVYTPGFLLNGQEWRSFYGLRKLSLNSDKEVGSLKLKVNNMEIAAEYKPTKNISDKSLVLNIVVLGFDIKTDVRSGENHGKELKHDFTVLGYKTIPLYKNDSAYTVMTELPEIIETAPRMAISAWVNKENDMTPVQAAGGWLDK